MFAVDAVNAPAELMIDPVVVVMLTALRLVVAETADELVTNALAPKITLRPEFKVIVPDDEDTVELIVRSPIADADVNEIFPAVLTGAAIVTMRPEVIVIAPKEELTAALTMTSVVVDISVTVPAPPALIAPLTFSDLALTVTAILPEPFVVIPLTLTLPALPVNEKLTAFNTTLVSTVVLSCGVTV
jgi:hypothetical protein